MARRRGLRGKLTRTRSLALLIIVITFSMIAIIGTGIGADIFSQGAFVEGTNFSVSVLDNVIPLALLPNYAVQCSLWQEGEIVNTDGSIRDIGFDTKVFNPNFLNVFDPTTNKQTSRVNTDILLRCHSTVGAGIGFTLTGGTLRTQWAITDPANTGSFGTILVGSPQTVSVSPSSNVLQSPTGGGINLGNRAISASTIDTAVKGKKADLNYLVELKQLITAELEFKFTPQGSPSVTQTKTVVLIGDTALGTSPARFLRIVNENPTPPAPLNNIVSITSLNTVPSPLYDNSQSPFFRIAIQLPQYQTGENTPKIDILKPSGALYIGNLPISTRSGDTFSATVQIRTGDLIAGNWVVKAKHDTRTGTDSKPFAVYQVASTPNQPIDTCAGKSIQECQGIIDKQTDPCAGLTGSSLDQCLGIKEQFSGCATGFVQRTNAQLVEIAKVLGSGGNIILQSGFTTSSNPVCVSTITIATYDVKLAQQSPTCGIGADCAAPPTGGIDDEITAIVNPSTGASAKALILYQIVYDGGQEIGNIESLNTQPVTFSPLKALEFAGIPTGKEDHYEFARLIVNPVIDLSEIAGSVDVTNSAPDFTYLWTVDVLKAGGATLSGVMDNCDNGCSILNMRTVGVRTGSSNIGLDVEEKFMMDKYVGDVFYQIASSDIQPNELIKAMKFALKTPTNDPLPFEAGDLVTIKLQVNGTFQPTITTPLGVKEKVIAAISPMEWSHTFTWIPQFGADDEPCADLVGLEQVLCLGNPYDAGGECVIDTCQVPNELTGAELTQCRAKPESEQFTPMTPEQCLQTVSNNPNYNPKDENGCKPTTFAGVTINLCYNLPEDEEKDGGSNDGSLGSGTDGSETEGKGGDVGVCPKGTGAKDCIDLIAQQVQEQLGSLGLDSATITAISNNAVILIIAVVLIVLVAAIAIKARNDRMMQRRFRGF